MDQNELLDIILRARDEKCRDLFLSGQKIVELPTEIGQLVSLQTFTLAGNELLSLPGELGQLVSLWKLNLRGNELTSLPGELAHLSSLGELDLSYNRLTSLPVELGKLTSLRELDLSYNRLTSLPVELGKLTSLRRLYIRGNRLKSLPEELGQLKKLEELSLSGNAIENIPHQIIQQGTQAIIGHLRQLLEDKKRNQQRYRYEGKLMLLGDGEEGKTCVSRALRGLEFEEQPTTRGVDVVPWPFTHPDEPDDKEKDITLNIWDFEGQEVHHQTHQFFLTTGSLYVLVFKCRELFNMERAEYWLDTIKARAPKSKVLLVITGCEERQPSIPEDILLAGYPELWVSHDPKDWCFPVGCSMDPQSEASGIPPLRRQIQRLAADMKVMGQPWPDSYAKAEEAIIQLRDGKEERKEEGQPHIARKVLYDIFQDAGIAEDRFDSMAAFMDSLGVITHFPDCEKLKNFIVLKPQWLGKAISEVLEDKELQNHRGYITFGQIQRIWEADYPGMFLDFYECMKEFELCYDLDHSKACLVPLRFQRIPPAIPWTLNPGGDILERRVFYKLNIRPPMGLMSRFIVKNHRLIAKTDACPNGVYWYNGVFLRQGEGFNASEALCEFDSQERMLSITVRAAFPQTMQEQLHSVAKAVFAFYQGIETERFYGCIKFDKNDQEQVCRNKHPEDSILSHQIEKMPILCTTRDEEGKSQRHKVDPVKLVYGFTSFGAAATRDDVEEIVDKAVGKLEKGHEHLQEQILLGFDQMRDDMDENVFSIKDSQQELSADIEQKVRLYLNYYLAQFDTMLDDRDYTSAPGLVSILPLHPPKDFRWQEWFTLRDWFTKEYVLTPYCECPGHVHRCTDASVIFRKNQPWWSTAAPLLSLGFKMFAVGITFATAGAPLAIGAAAGTTVAVGVEVYKDIKPAADFMKELVGHISKLATASADKAKGAASEDYDEIAEGLKRAFYGGEAHTARAQLQQLLRDIAPENYESKLWGDMRRVRMPDNSYRWMCAEHANQM